MSKVYVWLGHGSDQCDPVTKRVIRVPVPAGVTVVQSGVCGINIARTTDGTLSPFENPANLEMLQRATPLELKPLFGEVATHVSTDPNEYVNTIAKSMITLIHDNQRTPTTSTVATSGVCAVPIPSRISFVWTWTDPMPVDLFLTSYTHSVYPTVEAVRGFLKEVGVQGDTMTREQYSALHRHRGIVAVFDEVVATLPGVHYHTVCRGVAKQCIEDARAMRSASGVAHGRSQKAIEDLEVTSIAFKFEKDESVTESARLPHDTFSRVVDQIIARSNFQSKKREVVAFVTKVMGRSEHPEEYKPEYMKVYSLYRPDASESDKEKEFDWLLSFYKNAPKGGRRRRRTMRRRTSRRTRKAF